MSKKFDDEMYELVKKVSPNVVERVGTDMVASGAATYAAVILTAPMGWAKWPIRVGSFLAGAGVGEGLNAARNWAENRRLAEVLTSNRADIVPMVQTYSESYWNDNSQAAYEDVNDKIVRLKNVANGLQSDMVEVSEKLDEAREVKKKLEVQEAVTSLAHKKVEESAERFEEAKEELLQARRQYEIAEQKSQETNVRAEHNLKYIRDAKKESEGWLATLGDYLRSVKSPPAKETTTIEEVQTKPKGRGRKPKNQPELEGTNS